MTLPFVTSVPMALKERPTNGQLWFVQAALLALPGSRHDFVFRSPGTFDWTVVPCALVRAIVKRGRRRSLINSLWKCT